MPRRRTSVKHRKTPDALARTIGQRVRKLRTELDWSFDAFVEETGLGRGYVSELERGLVVPNVRVIERVAKALEVTMADLVLGDSPREQLFAMTRGLHPHEVDALMAKVTALKRGS
jgi:transcriptional regulator with XRE-family HTH domain